MSLTKSSQILLGIMWALCCQILPAHGAEMSLTSGPTVGYVAKNESVQLLFNSMSSEIKRPFVLSQKAQKKSVTGEFDLTNPKNLLEKLSNHLGLIWYDDGSAIYVYDSSELKNAVVTLRHAPLSGLNDFFTRTGLSDKRYPVRGDEKLGAFYISGPPMYVDMVVNAGAYIDSLYANVDLNSQSIDVIRLNHTFVGDRRYDLRDQKTVIPGIASVIAEMLSKDRPEMVEVLNARPEAKGLPSGLMNPEADSTMAPQEKAFNNSGGRIRLVAYPDTNSLLVKGTNEQVRLIQKLVSQLDVPKRHIELSLWIIDLSKNDLDMLGVDWSGALNVGDNLGVTLNGGASSSTLDGVRLLANVTALSEKGMAKIVSRPIILTQENVPAVFDYSHTFYTRLEAERVASLESVTYGTLINVLPRFSESSNEVEMVLNIEDGQQTPGDMVSGLPVITRTKINTVARVPKDKSLLIGGYTLDHYTKTTSKIPFLGDLSFIGKAFSSTSETINKVVRVFLIQPRMLGAEEEWNAKRFTEETMLAPKQSVQDAVATLKKFTEQQHGNH